MYLFYLQDAAKVLTYKLLKKFNVFQYNDTGMIPNHQGSMSELISTQRASPPSSYNSKSSLSRHPSPPRLSLPFHSPDKFALPTASESLLKNISQTISRITHGPPSPNSSGDVESQQRFKKGI